MLVEVFPGLMAMLARVATVIVMGISILLCGELLSTTWTVRALNVQVFFGLPPSPPGLNRLARLEVLERSVANGRYFSEHSFCLAWVCQAFVRLCRT
jgi:hypothetical protein